MDRFEKKEENYLMCKHSLGKKGKKGKKEEKANPSSAQACGALTNYVVKILPIIDHLCQIFDRISLFLQEEICILTIDIFSTTYLLILST